MSDSFELLENVQRRINRALSRRLKASGWNTSQALILRQIETHEKCSLADLSRLTVSDPAMINRTFYQLMKKGIVQRGGEAKDKRCWQVFLTEKGRRATLEINKVFDEFISVLNEALTHEQQNLWLELLLKLEFAFSSPPKVRKRKKMDQALIKAILS